MRKGSRFLVGFAAAALTFGSLFAVMGPDKFASCTHHGYGHHCGAGGHHWSGGHHGCQAAEPVAE